MIVAGDCIADLSQHVIMTSGDPWMRTSSIARRLDSGSGLAKTYNILNGIG